MIKKTRTGYVVLSKKGKPLSKPTLTKEEADVRLAQVERMKTWIKSKAEG